MDVRIFGGKDHTPVVVDPEGRMHVRAVAGDPLAEASWRGDAYHVLAEADLTGTSLTPVLWVQNDRGGKDRGRATKLVVDQILYSADANVHIETYLGATYTSGGGDAVVSNLNRGEDDVADVTAKDGSTALVLSTSSSVKTSSLFVGAYRPFFHDYDAKLLIPKGKSLAVIAQGANGNKVRVEFDFHWEPERE